MNVKDCKLGHHQPQLQSSHDFHAIRTTFDRDGIVFIDGCDEESLVTLANHFGRIVKPRNETGAGTGVANIRCVPGIEGKGYSSEELFFHTDRSGWDSPPALLMTTLKSQSEEGGESLLVDGRRVIEKVKETDTFLYQMISDPRHSSFRDEDGIFQPRPLFEETSSLLRFRFDNGIRLSNQLADRFSLLRQIIYDHAYAVALSPGQSYMVDNHRFLHGRTSFKGARELLRVLAYPHTYQSVKPILFDVDGTLCRSEALSIDAYFRCISDLTSMSITNENTKVNLHGATDKSLLHAILRYHGLREEEIESVAKVFFQIHSYYLQASLARGFKSQPCPEVQNVLKWLDNKSHEQGNTKPQVPVGLLTGNSQENALLKIKASGIDPSIFDLTISSFGDKHDTRFGLVKDSMHRIEEQYGKFVNAEDITLIGDTPLDIECAKQAHCGVIAVSTGNYTRDQLRPLHPDIVCETLPEAKPYLAAVMCR